MLFIYLFLALLWKSYVFFYYSGRETTAVESNPLQKKGLKINSATQI